MYEAELAAGKGWEIVGEFFLATRALVPSFSTASGCFQGNGLQSPVASVQQECYRAGMPEYVIWIVAACAGIVVLLLILRWAVWRILRIDERIAAALSRTKSAEVRLGKISETLAPLLDGFPVDVHKPGTTTIFLGQPVDFIHFDPEDGVSFIEVKSGGAKLSGWQKDIRTHIEAGRVQWREFRVHEPRLRRRERSWRR